MNSKHSQRLAVLNNQINRLDRRLHELQHRGDRLAQWRLISFAALFIFGAFVFLTWGALPWAIVILILIIPFALTVRWHRQVEAGIKRRLIWRDLKASQIARMKLDWDRIPWGTAVSVPNNHPFASDLDLIGERSLMRLLDVSITNEGSQRLCDWLLETDPNPERTEKRQAVVKELMELPALGNRLVLNATLAGDGGNSERALNPEKPAPKKQSGNKWSAEPLLKWLKKGNEVGSLRLILIVLLLFVPLNLTLLAGFIYASWPPFWLVSWFIYGAIMLSQSRKVAPLFGDAAYLNDSLRQISAVFDTLEKRSFKRHPALMELLAPLHEEGRRPSEHLKRANRLLSAAGLRINPVVAFLLNAIVPWDIFLAYRLIVFKQDLAQIVPEWLDLWFEIEALKGLANFGILYPEANFAEFAALENDNLSHAGNGHDDRLNNDPPFAAENLGHPLIAADDRICNDFLVEELGTVLIVSGSNMSGKSTFLRSLGVNICLALAGAPVLADNMRLVPVRVAASITVVDSLMDGFSYFYAEVRRLRALLDALKKPDEYPLFFLIDEIFRGTNNRERLIGSRSYVQALVGCYGTGLIATHDLELVNLAEAYGHIHNAHFRDDVADGRMVFDYKLHQGPCPTTNALKIMRLAGLPLEDEVLV